MLILYYTILYLHQSNNFLSVVSKALFPPQLFRQIIGKATTYSGPIMC